MGEKPSFNFFFSCVPAVLQEWIYPLAARIEILICAGTHTSYLLMIWYSKHFIKIDHKAKIQKEKTLFKSIGWSDPYYQSVNRTHSLITVAIIYVYALATAKWHIVDVNFRFKGGTNVHNKRFAHSIAMVCSFSFSFLFEMCNW